jgi:hypothetical protein
MQIETVEVGALAAGRLLDPQDLPAQDLQSLAGTWLDHKLSKDFSLRHRPRASVQVISA